MSFISKKRHSIGRRLLRAFILLVLLPTVVISISSVVVGYQNGRQQVINQLESVATLKTSEINTWIENLQLNLSIQLVKEEFERMNVVLSSGLPKEQKEVAATHLRDEWRQIIVQTALFEEIFLMDRAGYVLLSTDSQQEGTVQRNQTYFLEGLRKIYVHPPFYSPSLKRMSVVVSRPILIDGESRGILAGRASMKALNQIMLVRAGLGETGETYLVGSNNALLTDARFVKANTKGVGAYVRTESVNSALDANLKYAGLYNNHREVPVIGVAHWLPNLQVALVAEQEQAEAFNSIYITLGISLAVAVIASLSAIIVALFVTQSIARPVTNLTETATEIAGGNLALEAKVEADAPDEIAALAKAFNRMTARLSTLIGDLEQYRYHLEELVAQRTEELSETLENLKAMQEQLLSAKEAAEAANQAKSEFLSNMSHELRTPLNGILGYAQILRRTPKLASTEKRRIEIIYQSGHHLLTLINDILDVSKIEARKIELYPQDFHLASFLDGVVGIIRIRAQEKELLFVYEADEKLPKGINVDEIRLRQILLNLLGNAVKFTPQGQITLRVSCRGNASRLPKGERKASPLQLPLALPQQMLRFEVIDTGVGMTPDQLEMIFLPFEQVGDPKQRAQGTGLGLAITRQLVHLMGGEVYVESEFGKGSRFWFDLTLPVVEGAMIEAEIEQLRVFTGYKGKRLKVLVVDDKAENRALLRDLLAPLGFELYEGEDGQQAVELTSLHKPDLILTDLVMPVMDGFQAIKEIRLFNRDVPIIAISASVLEAEQRGSLKIGCNAFLLKPVDAPKLLKLIENFLQIEWLDEEEQQRQEEQSSEQALIAPSQAALKALYEAAMLGMTSQIRKQMDELEQLDGKYAPFASQVRELAMGFQDEKIVALVEQLMEV